MTHQASDPCPFTQTFASGDAPATCCSFSANQAVVYLFGLNLVPALFGLKEDKKPEAALSFAQALREIIDDYRAQVAEIKGSSDENICRSDHDFRLTVSVLGWSFRITEALETFEAAAAWYEQVSRMGFGVEARS
jgi:hypothetical protein